MSRRTFRAMAVIMASAALIGSQTASAARVGPSDVAVSPDPAITNVIPSSGSSTATIFGLQHTSLGGAILDTAGGKLIVSNIGSSGNDGVSIGLGSSYDHGHKMGFQLPAGDLNGSWDAYLVGQIGGLPTGTVFSAHATISHDTVHVNADFSSMGTTTRRLVIYNNGTLVFTNIGPQKSGANLFLDGFKYKTIPADMVYLGDYDDEGTYFP